MSNFGPLSGQQQTRIPTPPRGDTIARYATYLEAQRAVDYLSDQQFPVQFVTIVGIGLRMVERVTGRLTYPRVAVAGAASGAWFGLFVGLLLSIFGSGGAGGVIFAAVIVGAGFGMLFGIISYAFTGGRRDFTSTSQIVASEYEVLCLTEQAAAARELLGRLAAEGGPRPGAVAPPGSPGAPFQGSGTAYGGPSGPYAGPGPSLPPPPSGSVPSAGAPPSGGATAVAPGQQTPEPAAPVSGPTYGEMIERQRRERAEREQAERSERERAEREQAERGSEPPAAPPGSGS